MNLPLRPLLRFVILMLAAAALPRVQAQINVSIKLERGNYVSYESLPVTVTVTNTSGSDVVLGGPNNSSWLNFLVTSETGRPVTAIESPNVDAIVCKKNQALERKFNLPRHFHLIESGGYVVKASVYFPDLQRWLNSPPARFNIMQAPKPQWERTYTVPSGFKMAGKYRKYQLFTVHDSDRSYLYVRIVDESTGMYLMTTRFNSMAPDRQLQPAVDDEQNLHILCLASPLAWVYQCVDPDGKLIAQKFYKQGKGVPQLVAQGGGVTILGGTIYDPAEKPAPATANGSAIRRLSDRPAGVPLQ